MEEVSLHIELLAITPNSEKLLEKAGRICYKSESKESIRKQFIEKRIKQGHESLIEHASATFFVKGISRACSHQLVRHRLASYSQASMRYIDHGDFNYIVPPAIKNNPRAYAIFQLYMHDASETYKELQKYGILPEDCRFILPHACETEIIFTMNFRSWRNFLKLRLDSHAQWEIRALAKEIVKILNEYASSCFNEFLEDNKNNIDKTTKELTDNNG